MCFSTITNTPLYIGQVVQLSENENVPMVSTARRASHSPAALLSKALTQRSRHQLTHPQQDTLTFEQLQSVDSRFEKDVLEVFDYQKSVEMRSASGGTSRSAVLEQIEAIKKTLGAS